MNVVGLAIGVLLLAIPHLAAAQTGFVAAWGGLPFPGELLAVILAGTLAPHVPNKLRPHAPTALIASASLLAAFEAWCLAQGHAGMNAIAVGLAEEALHGLAMALWVVWLAFERAGRGGEANVALYVAAGLSGALWYAGMGELRLDEAMDVASIELVGWGFTLAWSVCAVAFLHRESGRGTRGSLAVVAVFSGVLLGNRGWWILYPLDVRFLIPGPVLAAVSVAIMLVCAILAWVLSARALPEDCDTMEEPASLLDAAGLDTAQLTAREREALELALEGATVDRSAESMGIARSTVASYRSRALSKLGIGSTQELLAMIREKESIAEPSEKREEAARVWQSRACQSFWDPKRASQAALLLALSLAVRFLVPQAFANALIVTIFACVFVAGIKALLRIRQKGSTAEIMVALLIGGACALALAGCAFGPKIYLARRIVLSLPIIYLLLSVLRHFPYAGSSASGQSCPYMRVRAVALTSAGLVGCALVPPGAHAIVVLTGAGWTTGFAVCVLVCAELLCATAHDRRLADLANASLAGDERKLAYLRGCGLGELEASVALLTAQGFNRSQTAASLAVSPSTVSAYRSSAYRALGVTDRQGLAALLSEQAGAGGKGDS